MNQPNTPEFDKYWELISKRKWWAICIWRHVAITFVVFTLLFFARLLLLIIFGWISHRYNLEWYNYVGKILLNPIPESIIVLTACIYANYSYWKHFEKLKELDIPIADGKESIRYKVVHLDDYFPIPYPLRFSNTNHYTSFLFHWSQHIIYVQHPETNEVFGYCRKCHQLMSLEQVEERKCPHCGNKIYYWGPH